MRHSMTECEIDEISGLSVKSENEEQKRLLANR